MPRVTPFHAVRHVIGGVVRGAGPGGAGASGEHAALAAVLSSHGFDLSQPLSLDSVRAWRSSPGEKRDEVFVTTETFVLRTTAVRTIASAVRCAESNSPFAVTTITSSNSRSRSRAWAGSRSRRSSSRCRAR